MNLRHYIYTMAVALVCCMSCADTEVLPEVSHRPLRVMAQPTQISGTNAGVAEKQELIHNYTLLFVNKATRRVEARIDKTFGDGEREYDQITFPIEISEDGGIDRHGYDVLAFANFTPEMALKTPIGEGSNLAASAEGAILSENYLATLKAATYNLSNPGLSGIADNYNGYDFAGQEAYIPMTGIADYTATMQYHQPVNIPLTRMLAKLNFKVRNLTGQGPLRLQKISVRPIQNTAVYLLPHLKGQAPGFYPDRPAADNGQYGEAGSPTNNTSVSYVPVLPQSEISASDTVAVTLDLTDRVVDPEKDLMGVTLPISAEYVEVGSLYVNESLAAYHPTGHFTYDLYFIDKDGGPHEYRYALSADDFKAFCRNDNVTIPLSIGSPSSLEPEVVFYPPIGGYPPVMSTKNDREFYATFRTGGEFAIYPHIWQEGKPTDIRLTDTEKVEFNPATDIIKTEVEPAFVFSTDPHYVQADNCIRGTLSGKEGKAIITIQAKMKDSNRLISKSIHIICSPV